MSDLNITPEAWTVDPDDPTRIMDVQECTIARTDFVDIEEEAPWQVNNAKLIAAAPRMYYALKHLHACHRGFRGTDNWTYIDDEARDAAGDILDELEYEHSNQVG